MLAIALSAAPAKPSNQAVTPPKVTAPLQDDGFGKCPAFSHYHALAKVTCVEDGDASYCSSDDPSIMDGKCHRDSDDSVIEPRKQLKL